MAILTTWGIFLVLIASAAGVSLKITGDGYLWEDIRSRNLSYADYSNLSLQEIPSDVPRNITLLVLMYNNITSLNDHFWSSDCEENFHNASCSRLRFLMVLDLSNNQINNISSHSLNGLEWLGFLFLKNNNLTAIDSDTFSNNRFLGWIDISGNKITNFHPKTFKNLTSLEILYLNNNAITDLHEDTFRGLDSLKRLSIYKNYITKLYPDIFGDLKSLQYLDISQNYLMCVSSRLFWNLGNLGFLNASHNSILYLGFQVFINNEKLVEVDFRHNVIQKISRNAFEQMLKMNRVNMAFNRLESVYLNNNEICVKTEENVPCFVPIDQLGRKAQRHYLDFSHNNISEVVFIKSSFPKTLEFTNIYFEGNPRLALPVSFIKKEKYILLLDLRETNLSFRNLTLFNEILQLQHLTKLSISGTAACEQYMQWFLSSVLNPDYRVLITCDEEHGTGSHTKPIINTNHLHDDLYNIEINDQNCIGITEENISNNTHYLSNSNCQVFNKSVLLNLQFEFYPLKYRCQYLIDCSYLGLSFLPEIKADATCLLFSANIITDMEQNYFLFFWDLEYLSLASNYLNFLHGNIFDNLQKLKVLRLNDNKLVHLNSSTFKSLTNLQYLGLQGNRISSYDADTLSHLIQLQLFTIDFWELKKFHLETFQNLSNLIGLAMQEKREISNDNALNEVHFSRLTYLKYCKITGFKANTSSVANLFKSDFLIYFVFSESTLSMVTSYFSTNSKNLEAISLNKNKIKTLSDNLFIKLNNLTSLDISENELTYLQTNLLADTINLVFLNLSHNQISCVPKNFFVSLSLMTLLDLRYNAIAYLAWESFTHLPRIKHVFLSENFIGEKHYDLNSEHFHHCKIENIAKNLTTLVPLNTGICGNENKNISLAKSLYEIKLPKLTFLTHFDVKHNCLVTISANAFRYSPSLLDIDLSNNNIYYIENDTFSITPVLRMLLLSHNSLSSIRNNLFRNLTHLEWLELQHNKIEYIEEKSFRDLHSLLQLNLGWNRLNVFDFDSLPNPSILSTFIMKDNDRLSLKIKQPLPSLQSFEANNTKIKNICNVLRLLPSLGTLELRNTNLSEIQSDCFENLSNLTLLVLSNNHLRGLTPLHFTSLRELTVLDLSIKRIDGNLIGNRLSWMNLTLINYWFEMPELSYLVLTGHPICDDVQWEQIIRNIFLSDKWMGVICSDSTPLPNFITSRNGFWYLVNHVNRGYAYFL